MRVNKIYLTTSSPQKISRSRYKFGGLPCIIGCLLASYPCEVLSQLATVNSQTQAMCDETTSGTNDDGYLGCQNFTLGGNRCQKWTSQSPHRHSYTPDEYPDKGLGDHNYCRDPDGRGKSWCYTTNPSVPKGCCDPLQAATFSGGGQLRDRALCPRENYRFSIARGYSKLDALSNTFQGRHDFEAKVKLYWKFIDSNCDGLITIDETMEAASKINGADHERVYGPWYAECTWTGILRDVHFIHHFVSELFRARGLVFWPACRLAEATFMAAQIDPRIISLYGSNSNMTEKVFTRSWNVFLDNFITFEQMDLQDSNGDGCISQAEYDTLVEWYCACCQRPSGSAKECRNSAPDFMDIFGATSLSYDGQVYLKDFASNSSCVTEVWYSYWSLSLALKNVIKVSEVALCHSEDNQTQVVAHSVYDQGESFDTSVIIMLTLSFGICSCVCVGLGVWAHRRHIGQGNDLHSAREVQKLLRAKIDTWSFFDTNLECKLPHLTSSFKHFFGIEDSSLVEFSLCRIIHPDDSESLKAALCAVKNNQDANSIPVLVSLRFEYGAGAGIRMAHEIQYLPVEILMTMASKSSILVGVTALASVQPQAIGATHVNLPNRTCNRWSSSDDTTSRDASGIPEGEYILNESDAASSSAETDAITFRSMDVASHRGGQVTRDYSNFQQSRLTEAFIGLRLEAPEILGQTANEADPNVKHEKNLAAV